MSGTIDTLLENLQPNDAVSVTPDDDNDLDNPGTLFIGGDGNVKVDTLKGSTVTYNGLTAGDRIPVKVRRVHNTDTTATNILVEFNNES